ncbi:MAG TPA: hypothetical protein VF978_07880 [Gemmatimonadales bacterium]
MSFGRMQLRVQEIERRLEALEKRVADLEGLKEVVGDLKYELEQMTEG